MALDTYTPVARDLTARLDDYFAGLGQGFNARALRDARMNRLVALDAMTDAELAGLGLTRDDIPGHVFADLFPK